MVEDLVREVAEQRAADEASKERLERIRKLMVRVRLETDLDIPDIEKEIDRFWDRATISRKTSADVKAAREKAAG